MEYQENRKSSVGTWVWIVLAAVGIVVLACACLGLAGAAAYVFGVRAMPARLGTPLPMPTTAVLASPTPVGPPATATTLPPPTALPDPTPVEALSAELPPRDRYDLARRFLGADQVPAPAPITHRVGDEARFWVDNDDTLQVVEVAAELVYTTDVVYMWVERGVRYNLDDIARSADRFSEQTYPTNRSYFGSEPSPGIDGDPRLHILHSTELGSMVVGYFYSPSQYPAAIVPYSNEKEIFFISTDNAPPGDMYYDSVLAHEFQHMIHWGVDQNEESWMNEGLSEVASFVNDLGTSGFLPSFLASPEIQLTHWPEGSPYATYGAGYLFNIYFLERFGQDALRMLIANPKNGLAGFDDTLSQIGADVTTDQLFVDWTIANAVNTPEAAPGIYGYATHQDMGTAQIYEQLDSGDYPFDSSWRQVNQYGASYTWLSGPGAVTLQFEGAQQSQVIPADTFDTDGNPATNDRFVWWSNRGDDSNMMLTRELDLTGVSAAVLEYDVWYDIETEWDYAYLSISTDGGATWTILPTPYTTTADPHGNSYGSGYTGRSADHAGADSEGWLHEQIDLSAYAGQTILARFEMLTDDSLNLPGMALDNICVAAIGWCDSVEGGTDGWEARGFLRHNNAVDQHYAVTVVLLGDDGSVEAVPLPLDDANRGELTVSIGREAILIVSGLTRHITEPAPYRYTIQPAN